MNVVYKDNSGRILLISYVYLNITYKLVNIQYASNDDVKRKQFCINLQKHLGGNVILMGDLNCALTKTDISRNNTFKGDISRGVLKTIIAECNLCDVWRKEHLSVRGFSRCQMVMGTMKQLRIDLALVASSMAQYVRSCENNFMAFSDHTSCPLWVN